MTRNWAYPLFPSVRFIKSKGTGDVMTLIASYRKSLVAGITCACLTLIGVQAMAATREATIMLPSAPTRIERFAAARTRQVFGRGRGVESLDRHGRAKITSGRRHILGGQPDRRRSSFHSRFSPC